MGCIVHGVTKRWTWLGDFHFQLTSSTLSKMCNFPDFIVFHNCHTDMLLLDNDVQFSCSVMSDSLWPHGLQQARLPCQSPAPWAYSNSCPSSWWCRPAISSSIIPFSSCLQSSPALMSSQMSQFFTWVAKVLGVSASASILQINIQDWFPLGWTCWISLQFKGLSRVFSNTTVQKHQFFGAQLSL